MPKRFFFLLTSAMALVACSSNPPEDARYEHFGTGLPQAHTESHPQPYPVDPILRENGDLNDQDKDGVINQRDDCHKDDSSTQTDTQGCAKTLSQLKTIDLDVQFETGSHKVAKKYYPSIEKLAELHKQNDTFIILIEGHTDSTGSRSGNMALSKARANAIAQVLIKTFDVSPSSLLTAGFGPDQPISSNDTPAGREKNRRMIAHLLTRDRVIAKRYNVWTIELGDAESTDKKLYEMTGS